MLFREIFRSRDATAKRVDAQREPDPASPVPENVEEVVRKSRELSSMQRYAEALTLIDEALTRAPGNGDLVFARGRVLFDSGRYRQANEWLRKAADLGIPDSSLYLQLGWTCMWTSTAESAEPWMRKAVDVEPDGWLVHFGLGSTLRAMNRIDDAIRSFERVVALVPDDVEARLNLADCALAQNRHSDAAVLARRVLALDPRSTRALTMLGVALVSQRRFHEAIEPFERAYEIEAERGRGIDPHLNLGMCLRDSDRLDEALALYRKRLPSLPSISASTHYAHALLLAGRLREGFIQYEFRWLEQPLLGRRPSFRKPVWDGQDLHGKTILLRTEQGLGDVFQFIRYAPYVKALGARVLLQARPGIGELARSFPGIDEILDADREYPPFDYYIHLMSLPRVFGTDLASVPAAVPYLRAEPARRAVWAQKLSEVPGFRVGVVWSGNPDHVHDRYRSISLDLFAPLAQVDGVRFYSLQKGTGAEQLANPPPGMSIEDLSPNFLDTAAIIESLDLTISIDTSVAHLAGALGRPVWTLLMNPPEWRWMTERSDTPWYPTMRLFRQPRQGDWEGLMNEVAIALAEEVRKSRSALTFVATDAVRTIAPPTPVAKPQHALSGLTGVAETVAGILQYDPAEPTVGKAIEYYGEYLKPQVDLLARMMNAGSVVLEVSPGAGIHVVSLAPAIANGGHYFVYESHALLRQVLQHNIAANGISGVTLMKQSLAGSRTAVTGASPVRASGEPASKAPASGETIDELRLEALDWIKIGADDDATTILRGAGETLWRLRPKLFVSAREEQDVAMVALVARDFGYTCWRFETPLFNPANFTLRNDDVFAGRTAIAVIAIPEEAHPYAALVDCTRIDP